MSVSRIKKFAFIAIIAALVTVPLQLSNSSSSLPDDQGIGGDWKPYALDAHSKMDNYFRVSGNEGVNTTNSEEASQVYYRWVSVDDQMILLDPPTGELVTVSPLSSYLPEGPLIIYVTPE